MENSHVDKKVKCPKCGYPHQFTEVYFTAANDTGIWEVECDKCKDIFYLRINNPNESCFHKNFLIKDRNSKVEGCEYAEDVVEYNIDLNERKNVFNYDAAPIYLCSENNENLELRGREEFKKNLDFIKKEYANAVNYCLSNRTPDYEFVVVKLKINCSCSQEHVAMFYCKFMLNGTVQQYSDEYLLADITSTNIEEEIDGLFSKSEIMTMLEKLIIRWNLSKEKIFIAAPFVGHQWLKKGDKLSTWRWLLSLIDHKKTIFITRKATFTSYKNVLKKMDGLEHEFLESYDLENKIISAEVKKQDFHAKFFIGISEGSSEVMSGSANLVTGPSIENISFKRMSKEKIYSKYIDRLKLKLPKSEVNNKYWIEIIFQDGEWKAIDRKGSIEI